MFYILKTSSGYAEGVNPFTNPEQSKPHNPPADIKSDHSGESSEVNEIPDDQVISRLHLNDDQRQAKMNFEKKKMNEARQEAITDKQRRKRVWQLLICLNKTV